MEELGDHLPRGSPGDDPTGRNPPTKARPSRRRPAPGIVDRDRFPSIWIPSSELCDLRALLWHRDQWVRMRTRVKNGLQGLALAHGIRRGAGLVDAGWPGDDDLVTLAAARRPSSLRITSPLRPSDHQIAALDQRSSAQAARAPASPPPPHPSGRGPGDRSGDRGVPGRSVTVCRCKAVGQLRRDDP